MFIANKMLGVFGRFYSRVCMFNSHIHKGKHSFLSFCDGHSIKGGENLIEVEDYAQLSHCRFIIKGSNNRIAIGKSCRLSRTTFWISGDDNEIVLGDGTTVGRNCEFATLEGTKIIVGKDCMFSHDILVRTSDSHSIVDLNGKRINPARDIKIGNHVWVGLQSLILKGTIVADNSVIGARTIVNKRFEEPGCTVAGTPATIIKKGINWDRRKL